MRRALASEPFSRAAVWSLRVALAGLACAAGAILASRFGRLEAARALWLFAGAGALAGAAILLALGGYGAIWRLGLRGAGRATLGLCLALGLLAWPLALALEAVRLPPAVDVSSDPDDPPDFSRSETAWEARRLRPPPALASERERAAVAAAYPDIRAITLDLGVDETFRLVEKVAAKLRWKPVEARAPGGMLGLGHLDFIDRSLFFGFPSDVTIRLTPLVGQTRVDLRSVARVGGHDIGAGARRFRAFSDALADETAER